MYSKLDSYCVEQTTENPVTINFYNALSSPLRQRCGELTVLFDRAPAKDLKPLFPILVDQIFSWNLRSIDPSHRDFTILHHFLGPLGPVFRLIYKLLSDSYVRYEYPFNQIPLKVRSKPFYNDLLGPDGRIHMNPFDYYIFQFGWHLMAPQRIASWNTVYYVLSCDYLTHFLPTDSSIPVPHVGSQFTGKNTLHHQTQNRNTTPISKLFRPQVLQSIELNTLHPTYQQQHPRSEIWRSETVIQVFVDIWLSNDYSSNSHLDLSYLNQTKLYDLPSGEYIRIIRFGIKQLYAFVDSGHHDISPSGELKKIVLPMIQSKMYLFLRNLIHRWPLDGSFRLLLELWLTYIQPWRYPAYYFQKAENGKREDDRTEIDTKYLRFIADNLLSYTQIFQQLLPRFLRIDLTSPKEAVLIYRVTKVFAQPNLVAMLREVEACVELNWSRNDYSQSNNGKWTTIVRQHMFDLEGPEFRYKPMFADTTQVIELLQNLQVAIAKVKMFLVEKEEAIKKNQVGFLRNFFMMTDARDDEFSMEERRKVPDELESAQTNLINIFNINIDTISKSFDASISSELNSTCNVSNPSFLNVSTPDAAKQRAAKIQYEGDPDLMPPGSSECSILVNILYTTSRKINEMYGDGIAHLYNRTDLYGSLARQFIEPPKLIKTYDKSHTGWIVKPRVQRVLPPRISLRVFAQNKFIYTVLFSFLFCLIFGYDYAKLLSIVMFGICVYVFCKALYQLHQPLTTNQSVSQQNIDDSMSN